MNNKPIVWEWGTVHDKPWMGMFRCPECGTILEITERERSLITYREGYQDDTYTIPCPKDNCTTGGFNGSHTIIYLGNSTRVSDTEAQLIKAKAISDHQRYGQD